MVAKRLDGKVCAAQVESELVERISKCDSLGIKPHLAVVIVGDDPASHVYVGSKVRACERLGIKSTHIELPEMLPNSRFEKLLNHSINRTTSTEFLSNHLFLATWMKNP